jgi:hypothetical protein
VACCRRRPGTRWQLPCRYVSGDTAAGGTRQPCALCARAGRERRHLDGQPLSPLLLSSPLANRLARPASPRAARWRRQPVEATSRGRSPGSLRAARQLVEAQDSGEKRTGSGRRRCKPPRADHVSGICGAQSAQTAETTEGVVTMERAADAIRGRSALSAPGLTPLFRQASRRSQERSVTPPFRKAQETKGEARSFDSSSRSTGQRPAPEHPLELGVTKWLQQPKNVFSTLKCKPNATRF